MKPIFPDLKILMISPAYYPSQGGVQVEIRLLVDELVKRGYQITLITKEISGIPKVEKTKGLDIYRLPDSKINLDPWNGLLFLQKNLNSIKKIIGDKKIDVIHVHQFDISSPYVYVLKKIFKIPIISTVHTSLMIDREYLRLRINPKEPFRWILRILPILWFEKKSIRASDYIITVSKNLEKFCKSVRADDNVITIPNAINLQQFHPAIVPIDFHIKGSVILCPGRISPEKGQLFLVDALKIVREKISAQVIFLGSEHANMIPVIKNRIRNLNLDEYIHIVPAKSYDSISVYYKGADLIVIPSLSESFGLTILENMALGNVIVASNVGGIPDLIEHRKTGILVPPADPQRLADGIILALTDNELRNEIKKNAIEKAKDYSINRMVDETEQCYQQLQINQIKVSISS